MRRNVKIVAITLIASICFGLASCGTANTDSQVSSSTSEMSSSTSSNAISSTSSETVTSSEDPISNLLSGLDPENWTVDPDDYPDKKSNKIQATDITQIINKFTNTYGGKAIAFKYYSTSSGETSSTETTMLEFHYLPSEEDWPSSSLIASDFISFCYYIACNYQTFKNSYDSINYNVYLGKNETICVMLTNVDNSIVSIPVFDSGNSFLDTKLQYEYDSQLGEYDFSAMFSSNESELSETSSQTFNESDYEAADYETLARNPQDHIGDKVKLSGSVIQVVEDEDDNSIILLVAIDDSYDDVVLAVYTPSEDESRILEDDNVTMYGTMGDLVSYTTVLGAEKSVPSLLASKVVINS